MTHVEFTDQGDGMFSWSIHSSKPGKANGEQASTVLRSYEPMPRARALMALASSLLHFKGEYQITFKNGLK